MKKPQSDHGSNEDFSMRKGFSQLKDNSLGQFFDLLLHIDRRNNSGLYESNKDRHYSDSPSERSDGLRVSRNR